MNRQFKDDLYRLMRMYDYSEQDVINILVSIQNGNYKSPIAQKGDCIEITQVHTKGSPKNLKIGVRLIVASMWMRGDIILCRAKIDKNVNYSILNSTNYTWKIVK